MKKYLIPIVLFLAAASIVYAQVIVEGDYIESGAMVFGAPSQGIRYERSLIPETDSKYELGTSSKAWLRLNVDEVCITGDSCKTTWPSASTFTGVLNDVSDVSTTTTSYGDLLLWNGTAWTNKATSTLGITAVDSFTLTAWYATTSAPQLTTLANLNDIGTITKLDYTRASGTLISFTTAFGALDGNAKTATALAADPSDCAAGTAATAIAANGNLTCGITPLISGGTLTSGYHCRYDGTGIDCDRVEDASGACAANAVCMGGHNHDVATLSWANDWMLAYSNNSGLVELPFGATPGLFLRNNGEAAPTWVAPSTFALISTAAQNYYFDLTTKGLIATSSLQIPSGTAPTTDATGEIALDTTESQVEVFDGTASRILDFRHRICVPFASSTPILSGEDKWIGSMPYDVTFYDQEAKVDNGTTLVINIGDGSNDMTAITASSTSNINVVSANNTFSKGEDIEIEFGTNTGSVLAGFWCGSYRIDSK